MISNLSLRYKHVVEVKYMCVFGTSMTPWQLKKEKFVVQLMLQKWTPKIKKDLENSKIEEWNL
jgi:hypothetical protein